MPYDEPQAGLDELDLIRLAAKGDVKVFAEIVRRIQARVHRLAARICGPSEAEDVAQVVFVRLWRHLPLLESAEHMNRWLTRVTVNRAIEAYRHVGRRLRLLQQRISRPQPSPQQLLDRLEITKVFSLAAESLGERQRAAFVLREMEGYDTGEVADIMGVKASTVRNLVSQARGALQRALRAGFPEYAPPESSKNG